jgi:hypothetical protein
VAVQDAQVQAASVGGSESLAASDAQVTAGSVVKTKTKEVRAKSAFMLRRGRIYNLCL